MKYRKKPVVIEAFQWNDMDQDIPEWASPHLKLHVTEKIRGSEYLTIGTLEGEMTASRGDWIIQGIKGEVYPCKPDIFAATYDLVDEGRPVKPHRSSQEVLPPFDLPLPNGEMPS